MTNEVRIDVTGKETAGPALDAVRAKSKSLGDTVKVTATSLKDSATAATAAAAATDKAAAANAKAIAQAQALDRQIDELRGSLRDLAGEYAENQDKDLLAKIKTQQATLREQLSVRKLLPTLVAEAADAGTKVGETLASKASDGLGKATKAAANVGEKLGTEIGTKAAPALAASLTTKLASTGGSLGIAAAPMAAGLATFLGATVAGAIIGGVGVGGVVGGVAAASQHASVKSSATALADEFRVAGQQAGAHMVGPTVQGIGILRSHLREAQGDMDRIAASSGRLVRPLAEGIGRGARSLLEGVADVAERAEPAVQAIGDGLARIGDAAGDGLSSLADNAASGGRALAMTFAIVEAGTRTIFDLINGLTELYGWLELGSAVWTGNTDGLAQMVAQNEKAKEGNTSFAESLDQVLAGFRDTETEAEDAARAIRDYADAVDQIVDQNLDAAEAALRYRDALREAKKAADDKKAVSDAEQEQLLRLARGANTYTDSLEQQGASTRRLSEYQKKARADFVATAVEMGYSSTKAQELADDYLKIPRRVATAVTADTDQAARSLRYIRDLGAQIKSKRVVITTVHNTIVTRSEGRNVGIGDGVGGRAHGGITGAAAGGIRGALTWVGERGPELLDLPPGTMVHPAGTSQRIASEAASDKATVIIHGDVVLQGVQRPEDLVRGLQEYTLRNGVIRGVAITP